MLLHKSCFAIKMSCGKDFNDACCFNPTSCNSKEQPVPSSVTGLDGRAERGRWRV